MRVTKRPITLVVDRPADFTLSLEPWALGFDIPARTKVQIEISLDSESEWQAQVAEEDDGRWVVAFMFPIFRLKIGDDSWQAFDYS
jgi:hypothetical protein